ncbi:neurocan core protein, partial [Plakobranchus ocellatus]
SWTATTGKIYTRDCEEKSTPTDLNKIAGKLYTSACCPDDYQVRSQSKDKTKCLRYSSGKKKFEDAQKECFDEGGHLTMFKTKKELDFVLWLLKCQEDTWIGIRDNCEHKNIDCKQNPSQRDIYWVDKEKVQGDVHKAVMKVIDNNNKVEHCVHVGGVYTTFNDNKCSKEYLYVCEKNALRDEIYCP